MNHSHAFSWLRKHGLRHSGAGRIRPHSARVQSRAWVAHTPTITAVAISLALGMMTMPAWGASCTISGDQAGTSGANGSVGDSATGSGEITGKSGGAGDAGKAGATSGGTTCTIESNSNLDGGSGGKGGAGGKAEAHGVMNTAAGTLEATATAGDGGAG